MEWSNVVEFTIDVVVGGSVWLVLSWETVDVMSVTLAEDVGGVVSVAGFWIRVDVTPGTAAVVNVPCSVKVVFVTFDAVELSHEFTLLESEALPEAAAAVVVVRKTVGAVVMSVVV